MRHLKQIDSPEWVKGIAHEIADLRYTPKQLAASHGITFKQEKGWDFFGDVELAFLQTRSGVYYGLFRSENGKRHDITAILVDERLTDATQLLNEIMCEMGWRSADLAIIDLQRYEFQPHELLRIDDNGNRISIRVCDCYPDAFFEQQILEEHGHKQTYLIEPLERKPKGWIGSWLG